MSALPPQCSKADQVGCHHVEKPAWVTHCLPGSATFMYLVGHRKPPSPGLQHVCLLLSCPWPAPHTACLVSLSCHFVLSQWWSTQWFQMQSAIFSSPAFQELWGLTCTAIARAAARVSALELPMAAPANFMRPSGGRLLGPTSSTGMRLFSSLSLASTGFQAAWFFSGFSNTCARGGDDGYLGIECDRVLHALGAGPTSSTGMALQTSIVLASAGYRLV